MVVILAGAIVDRDPNRGREAFEGVAKEAWSVDTNETANDPLAGYVKHLPAAAGGQFAQFTYAVVRGAGHMVPTDQPQRAYDLITTFVDDAFSSSSSSSSPPPAAAN